MSQSLDVNLTIQIPKEYILITKIEYEELKQEELKGVYWTMADLEKRVSRNQRWIKEFILESEIS